MKTKTLILAALFSLTSCATFNPGQSEVVRQASTLQGEAIGDPHFAGILLELQRQGSVDWEDRLGAPAATQAAAFQSPMEWLLAAFSQPGPFILQNIRAWRKWNPISSTTAQTQPYQDFTSLNLWKLSGDPISVANTLVHERVHSFGLIHPESQTREVNQCDAAYLAGDLVEAILATRAGGRRRVSDWPVCAALCRALERRGLWSPCQERARRG